MTRTQLYLSASQHAHLSDWSLKEQCTKSDLVRAAIDLFIAQKNKEIDTKQVAKKRGLEKLAGMWADRDEMADPSEYVRTIRAPRF